MSKKKEIKYSTNIMMNEWLPPRTVVVSPDLFEEFKKAKSMTINDVPDEPTTDKEGE